MSRPRFIFMAAACAFVVGTVASAQPPQEPQQPQPPQEPQQPQEQQQPQQDPQPPAPDAPERMDLEALLQRVADATGREFLIHRLAPDAIRMSGTVEETPTYEALLGVLRSNGLAAIEIQGIVNVVPEPTARQLPMRVAQTDDPSIADDELVSRVVTVRNVNAAQLVPLLRPMLPQYAHLAALPSREDGGRLVIVGRYANVQRITEIIGILDGQ